MARILIVEDEPDIVMSLEEDLRRQGYETGVANDGVQGLALGKEGGWDLILLDVMLPRMDGFDVCAGLRRARVRTPIILLTARVQEAEKILGLDAGADDYVTKPFSLRELRARIRAQLRRALPEAASVYRFGDSEIDFDRAELKRSGRHVEITAQELRLLAVLVRNCGRVLSRDQLIEAAWGRGIAITGRAVDSHIFNLRKKIEPIPSQPKFLIGVRGLGYRFENEN
ncbi:MAG TPA: response regulator transcription factor [Bryobacteraceae bacterium]|nr:response regulator transcription factor [Bryobacteraceae bacterium]